MSEFWYRKRLHVAVGLGLSAVISAFYLAFDLSIALLPAMLVPVWIALLAKQESVSCNKSMRWVIVGVLALGLVVGVLVGLLFFLSK